MIQGSTLRFLKLLSENNNRDWFEQHKADFTNAQLQFREFIQNLILQMQKFDRTLEGVEAGKTIFRIYRDVRFSKDKSPYKINFGAYINRGGKKSGYAGYYLNIQPGNQSFAAVGSYMPEPDVLQKIRQEIDYNGQEFKKIISSKKFKDTFGDLEDFKQKTIPKGYTADNPSIEYLKQKSFIVSKYFKDSELKSDEYLKNLIAVFKSGLPLVAFINRSL